MILEINFHRNDKLRVVSTTYVQLKWIVLCARKFEFEATFFSKYEKNSEVPYEVQAGIFLVETASLMILIFFLHKR